MTNINEKMLEMVASYAESSGEMKALRAALERENAGLKAIINDQKAQLEMCYKRIGDLEMLLQQANDARPQIVVNRYYVLDMPKTNAYVRTLSNTGRLLVCHLMHHALTDDTPESVKQQVDEITSLEREDGGVVIQTNNGPVNGNINTQQVGVPPFDPTKQLENHGQRHSNTDTQ